jgi:hypothetical protein
MLIIVSTYIMLVMNDKIENERFVFLTYLEFNNSVLYFLYISHLAWVNSFTIRTGIFYSGLPITGTSCYFYMVALADWVTV